MKNIIYIVFFIGYSVVYAQPPVERNNAVINSAEAEIPAQEVKKKELTAPQQPASAQTINDFYELHKKANSLPGQKNPTAHQQRQMDHFIRQNQLESTTSFEYNISTFLAGNYDISKKPYLDRAKAMQPQDQQVLLQSVGVSYILEDEKTLISDLKQLQGRETWNEDDFSYARDVLASVPANGVLITHGINDTYPILHLQFVENYRKDVSVVAMHLMQSSNYRKKLSDKKINSPDSRLINVQYIKEFCALNENSEIYLALTIPQVYFSELEQRLYPIGLTFRYSHTAVKNSDSNLKLWNELNKSVITKNKDTVGKQLSANYLPLLLNLYKYYETEKNTRRLTDIKNTVRQIGKNIGNEDLLNDLGLNE